MGFSSHLRQHRLFLLRIKCRLLEHVQQRDRRAAILHIDNLSLFDQDLLVTALVAALVTALVTALLTPLHCFARFKRVFIFHRLSWRWLLGSHELLPREKLLPLGPGRFRSSGRARSPTVLRVDTRGVLGAAFPHVH